MLCLAKDLNKANKCCSNFFYKMLRSFAKTRYPSLLFRPIRLEICQLWANAKDLEGKVFMCQKGLWKRLRKKRLAVSQKCTENRTQTRTRTISVTLISLFCPCFLSVDLRETRRQVFWNLETNNWLYTPLLQQKSTLRLGNCAHTHTLYETVKCCQKNVEVERFS